MAKEFLPSMKNRYRERSSFQYNESEEEVNLALDQTSVHVDPQNAVATFEYIGFPNYNIFNTTKDRFEIAGPKLLYYVLPVQQFSDANRKICVKDAEQFSHEVKFDRGQNPDKESIKMIDCLLRIDSFLECRDFRGTLSLRLILALWGFYHIEDPAYPDRIKCYFCRKQFPQIIQTDLSLCECDEEILLIRFKNRHSFNSSSCPISLGLKGDNQDITRDRLNKYFEDQHFQIQRGFCPRVSQLIWTCKIPHLELNELRYSFSSIGKEDQI